MRVFRNLGIGLGAAIAAFVGAAVGLAVLDLYLTGHGYPALSHRTVISHPGTGIFLSAADLLVLGFSFIAGLAAFWLSWRRM